MGKLSRHTHAQAHTNTTVASFASQTGVLSNTGFVDTGKVEEVAELKKFQIIVTEPIQ